MAVEEDEGQRPLFITLRRRRLEVASIDDTWEISDEWWRPEPIARMYHRVTTEDGDTVTIYRDLIRGEWYEQRA